MIIVDGKVVSYGKVLRKDEARAIIQKARAHKSFLLKFISIKIGTH